MLRCYLDTSNIPTRIYVASNKTVHLRESTKTYPIRGASRVRTNAPRSGAATPRQSRRVCAFVRRAAAEPQGSIRASTARKRGKVSYDWGDILFEILTAVVVPVCGLPLVASRRATAHSNSDKKIQRQTQGPWRQSLLLLRGSGRWV